MATMSIRKTMATKWTMSVDLVCGALWNTRRQSQLESEPCEAGRSNPSRQRAFTRLRTEREARRGKDVPNVDGQTSDRCWCAEDAGQVQRWVSSVREHAGNKHAQSSDDDGGFGSDRHESRRLHSQNRDVLELGEHIEELLDVFDFTSQLDVWRVCRKIKRWDSTVFEQSHEHVMFLFSNAMPKLGASGPFARKIMYVDASRVCWADATVGVAVESLPEEQAKSFYHNWQKLRRNVLPMQSDG